MSGSDVLASAGRNDAANASIPVYAIGGLTREDLDNARAAGAHGLAMIRGSWTGRM